MKVREDSRVPLAQEIAESREAAVEAYLGIALVTALVWAAVWLLFKYKRRARRKRYLKQLIATLEFADPQTANSRLGAHRKIQFGGGE